MSDHVVTRWNRVLEELQNKLPRPSFETWIRPTEPMGIYGSTLILGVASETNRQVVEHRFLPLITSTVSQVFEQPISVRIVAPQGDPAPAKHPPKRQVLPHNPSPPTLNPKYTFETFVIGDSNRFAHAASIAVSENPARAYNPLFLYGGVGLGKTHLMHAIGHEILKRRPELKVVYVSSETFTNELINSIRDDKPMSFRNRFRNIDILLIDDIQFLAGKERTQEEFFHTFEALHGAAKQLVISSDRPPKDISTLEERLRSRFEWGLVTDIQPPDLETRIAILRKKSQIEHFDVPVDVLGYIASRVKTNIRELEGALIRLVAYLSLHKETPTPELAARVLRDILPEMRPKQVTIKLIQNIVGQYYGLTGDDFSTKRRTRAISYPRQIAMYLARELTDFSLPKIGEEFGGRDHTTVIHACDKVQRDMLADASLSSLIDNFIGQIRG